MERPAVKPDDHSGAVRADSFEQRWRRRFEQFAGKSNDDAGIAGWSATGLETRLRHFSRLWRDGEPDAHWLDAGCGAGTYSRFLAGKGLRVVGLDYSFPTIAKARERGAQGIDWGVADVTCLPVKSEAFDGALCFGVMQALSGSAPAVRELARAVRPGGTVWVDALNAWCLPHLVSRVRRRLSGKPAHLRYEKPGVLRRTMLENGFVHAEVHWLPILPAGWQRFQHWLETPATRWLLRYIPPVGALLSHSFVVRAERSSSR